MKQGSRIIVTGASGFLGRRVVKLLRHHHQIIAFDRRTRSDSLVAETPDVQWFSVDIADRAALTSTIDQVCAEGGAAAVIHLAAWYDFSGKDNLEYTRTNVEGTAILLEQSERLKLERFVFASSVAACDFSAPSRPITETTAALAEHAYGRSKRAGEALIKEWAARIPCAIVRLAALFSDWCEYPPLYVFLDTWLSSKWNRRILGGHGRTSIPFLHVRDAADCLHAVLKQGSAIESGEIFLASPDGAVSHRQLFEAATAYASHVKGDPILMPKSLAYVGMWGRVLAGRLTGHAPFEQPWMARYLDTELAVDAQRTRQRLGWAPKPRLGVLHRLPFLIENQRAGPMEWLVRNKEAMDHDALQSNYVIFRLLERHQEQIEAEFQKLLQRDAHVLAVGRADLPDDERRWSSRVVMRNLIHAVRTGDRSGFMQFARDLALRRAQQGFTAQEVAHSLSSLNAIVCATLRADPAGAALGIALHDYVTVTLDFGVDRVHEIYEDFAAGVWR